MWKVEWRDDSKHVVATTEELESLLDRLHLEHEDAEPILAVIESQINGDSLAIGLGRPLSVLNFVRGSGDPPYLTSLGTSDEEKTMEFDFMGQISEFPIRNAVPTDTAREAVHEFVKTGGLPRTVRWEED